jgi:hypothetical protein
MNVQEKYESLDNAIKSLDEIPVTLTLSEEEEQAFGLWISKALAVAYDKGFEDGRSSR